MRRDVFILRYWGFRERSSLICANYSLPRRAGRRGRVLLGTERLVIKTANSAWDILVRQRTASFAEGGNQCE
jgi:hypothetical protein